MNTGTIRIRIKVARSTERKNTSCQLWVSAARKLSLVWDSDKYV